METGYVEVAPVDNLICCECGCPESSTKMRYVYFDADKEIRAYCADHYRQWMIAVHGEETVKMLEESTEWHDVLNMQEV